MSGVLIVPASADRFVERARRSGAGPVVIDLEDAVPAPDKPEARSRAVAALAGDWGERSLAVRVNARGTPWFEADVAAVTECPALTAIVVPKVNEPADVTAALAAAARHVSVHALIETAGGLQRLAEIAATRGLAALVLGYADLAAALRREPYAESTRTLWQSAQDAVVVAARANGIVPIDGPHMSVGDDESLAAAALHARRCGFDAKWVIHPGQLDTVDRAFAPTPADVARAEAVIATLDFAAGAGRGAAELDGEMVDEAHRAAAEAVLARARA